MYEAEDPLPRQVSDVGHAVERQQVMHAQRLERDAPQEHQLVIALVIWECRQIERFGRQQLRVRGGHPAGRLTQPLLVEVGAERDQQLAGSVFSRIELDRVPRGRGKRAQGAIGRLRSALELGQELVRSHAVLAAGRLALLTLVRVGSCSALPARRTTVTSRRYKPT